MKKILILAVIVLSLTQIYAQDNIDPIPLFRKDTLGVYDHRENKFILSWNCITNTNINRPNDFLEADNSASKKLFVQLIKFV